MIKQILDEIAGESSTNKKMEILGKYKDNETLKQVLYLAVSKRIKFYIKQIPEYVKVELELNMPLEKCFPLLKTIYSREVTGHAAVSVLHLMLQSTSIDDAYVIERIIDKDLKIGMGRTNINKVFPDLIEKTGYMGCKPYSKKLVEALLKEGHIYTQEKEDGRYVNIIIQNHELEAESRQGEPTLLDNPIFFQELKVLNDCVLNGELIMTGMNRYTSNGIISSLVSIGGKIGKGETVVKDISDFEAEYSMKYREALDKIVFRAWDMISIDEYFDRYSAKHYSDRLADVSDGFAIRGFKYNQIVETWIVSSIEEIKEHYEAVQARGGEGTVLKSMKGAWCDKKPNYQVKIKKEINLDLKIVGFNYGTGKNINVISSINVESSDGLLKTKPTGINEAMMKSITENQENLLGTILEIKCSGVSQDREGNYSVLHPVFKLLRTDKTEANSLEECIEIDKSASLI